MSDFPADISRRIWETRYRLPGERTIEETRRRVARSVASAEPRDRVQWETRFAEAMADFRFLPGGRIQAGAGAHADVTLFNCFVMGVIEDSLEGIFGALEESAVTMQQGGGVGLDFSTLRPAGSAAKRTGQVASGPVSFMDVWDSMCATILSSGARRGAMMGTLRCDHPDIETFVAAKHTSGRLEHFNLSVLITDAFMAAVEAGREWPLVFPVDAIDGEGETLVRAWPGRTGPAPCRIVRQVDARELWEEILRSAYDTGEPGVLFIDRINRLDNLSYCERIIAANPCGEVPLPAYGACDLGSLNLSRFVIAPFTPEARLDFEALAKTAEIAVRMLDDVVDVSRYPLPRQAQAARGSRRIGLGLTALADAFIMMGQVYGEAPSLDTASEIGGVLRDAAYRASVSLAREKGPFPLFDRDAYLNAPFVQALSSGLRGDIAEHGIRNSHLLAIAPTGTISLLAGAVSSGVEPVYAADYERTVLDIAGAPGTIALVDYAVALWRKLERGSKLPPAFVTVEELDVGAHLKMQAALQPFIDNSISKTVNLPHDCGFDAFREAFETAWSLGLKGCTAFRPNPVTGAVLRPRRVRAPKLV